MSRAQQPGVKAMLRLFTLMFQTDLNKLPSALSIFQDLNKRFNIHSAHCPKCNSKALAWHDSYDRNLVAYECGEVETNWVAIRVAECQACYSTHAILPEVLVPYKQYGILFILYVLKAYYFRNETVASLCERFGIAIATLYAWKKRYLSHKTLHLGKLEKYLHTQDQHLSQPGAACSTGFFYVFFQKFGFSFMQYSPSMATRSDGP